MMNRKREIQSMLLSNESYIVEKILRKFMKDGMVHYEVKWVGYDETTIEPETNTDIKALVEKKERMEAYGKNKKAKNIEKQSSYQELRNGAMHSGNTRKQEQSSLKEPKKSSKQEEEPIVPEAQLKRKHKKDKIPKTKQIYKSPYEGSSKRNNIPNLPSPVSNPPEVASDESAEKPKSKPAPIRIILRDQGTQTDKKHTLW